MPYARSSVSLMRHGWSLRKNIAVWHFQSKLLLGWWHWHLLRLHHNILCCLAVEPVVQEQCIENYQADSQRTQANQTKPESEKSSQNHDRPVENETTDKENDADGCFSTNQPAHTEHAEE